MVLSGKEEARRLMSDAMRFPYPNGWYMAVADSETVAARGLSADGRRAVAAELRRADLHFVNFYGGMVTEDWDGWRGEILPNVPEWVWR